MNKRIIAVLALIIIISIGLIVGRTTQVFKINTQQSNYMPILKIVGDVNKIGEISSVEGLEVITIQDEDRQFQAITIESILQEYKPVTEKYDILLVGHDGLFARLDGNQLQECYIHFSKESGWTSFTKHHPINSKIKELKEIVVVAKDKSLDYGVNIITPEENVKNITPGQLYFESLTLLPYYDGESVKESGGKNYQVKLYKMRRVLPINEIVDISNKTQPFVIMGEKGDFEYIDGKGYLELRDNTINYINIDKRKQIENVKGIVTDIPNHSIMDAYYDALHYLGNDENVLVIYIDGFGYHQYKYGVTNGYMPYMQTKDEANKALSVYKPVTNSGFAAMITGQPPIVNGIHDRKGKNLKVHSIFGEALKLNKKAALIEGSIKIINTEIEPILNIDKNKNDSTDDEVLETSLKKINEEINLLLVHFHSVDDKGHGYGDLAEETMDTLKKTDAYVKKLVENWEGKVIITSDHGMHKTNEGGTHGFFRYENIVVPYITMEGGK